MADKVLKPRNQYFQCSSVAFNS